INRVPLYFSIVFDNSSLSIKLVKFREKDFFGVFILIITYNLLTHVLLYNKINGKEKKRETDMNFSDYFTKCSKLFRDGRKEIEDKARPGRPITETTTENIEQVRLLINYDPYITLESIQIRADASYGTVQ
ncbi:unnamed protein product, partial [Rotaria magnacalcarata]